MPSYKYFSHSFLYELGLYDQTKTHIDSIGKEIAFLSLFVCVVYVNFII